MIKEDVLDALSALGFIPNEIEGIGFEIEYEGLTMLYAIEENDDSKSINFIVPGIFEVSDDNKEAVYDAIVELGGNMKYAQAYIMFGNKVWINYAHYIGENDVTPQLIEHIITVLAYATANFHKIMIGDENNG